MSKLIDLTGVTSGRLQVINYAGAGRWQCLCECGNFKDVPSYSLSHGLTKSCGCLAKEVVRARQTTHGLSALREYRTWCRMINRCENSSSKDWGAYGGRGITVCDKWRNSFVEFLSDMGPAPAWGELDRVAVNGNYEPGNCRWLDRQGQNNNRRSNVRVEYQGETKTLSEWGRDSRCVVPYETFRQRLQVCGWTIEKALTEPHQGWGPNKSRIKK